MRIGDVIYFMFVLILIYLLVANWKGATALLVAGSQGVNTVTRTLQGR